MTHPTALTPADLALLHTDLPAEEEALLSTDELDPDELTLLEWDAEAPLVPLQLVPLEWTARG
ncbi:hypothetical protein K7W42_04635 [Deinococcus sp. HMF7604]|uniref:hypothetical protein n=1 Tax=Deinococcus betulae TaxID=2873312 RepID=UPI001CCD6D9D|nr:hypothetical protein [Deinococcus betulae]MBZ9750146.1 hypothetical protein [Deinococcus betulae]